MTPKLVQSLPAGQARIVFSFLMLRQNPCFVELLLRQDYKLFYCRKIFLLLRNNLIKPYFRDNGLPLYILVAVHGIFDQFITNR